MGVSYIRPKAAVEPPNLTDMGNAARMARANDGDIKYSQALGWLIWDGTRFRRDDTSEIQRRARETVKRIYLEAADAADKDRREALAAWAVKSESESKIRSMISLCQSEERVAVRSDVFDKDPFLVNAQNGPVDLRAGELRKFNRADMMTKIAGAPYDPNATCSTWYRFLEQVLPDPALVEYVQKLCGLCLTGDAREQVFHIFHGLGANGKSTFVKTLLKVLGDYATQSPVETFLVKHGGGGIPNDVARLAGARLVVASESEANQRLAESLVKALTGGDMIAARFLHREFFEFEPQFKLILSTNHRPRIIGTDNAIWRRVRLIPFNVTIPPNEQDKKLPEKLEAELPGILRWCVDGCLAWQQKGLEPPLAITGASDAYKQDMDVLGDFLAARCEVEADATETTSALYAAYADFSENQKDRERDRLSKIAFGAALHERGFEAGRNHGGRFYKGLRLRGVTQ